MGCELYIIYTDIALSGAEYTGTLYIYCAFTIDCKLKVEARNRDESQSRALGPLHHCTSLGLWLFQFTLLHCTPINYTTLHCKTLHII